MGVNVSSCFGAPNVAPQFVDLAIEGLDPAPNDKTYVVWLMLTEEQGYPLSPITVSANGSFSNRFSIPGAVLPVVARVQFVDVSIAPVKTIRELVRDGGVERPAVTPSGPAGSPKPLPSAAVMLDFHCARD